MKIEKSKSAKGNERKQNKPANLECLMTAKSRHLNGKKTVAEKGDLN